MINHIIHTRDVEGLKESSEKNNHIIEVKNWLADEMNKELFEKYKLKS